MKQRVVAKRRSEPEKAMRCFGTILSIEGVHYASEIGGSSPLNSETFGVSIYYHHLDYYTFPILERDFDGRML